MRALSILEEPPAFVGIANYRPVDFMHERLKPADVLLVNQKRDSMHDITTCYNPYYAIIGKYPSCIFTVKGVGQEAFNLPRALDAMNIILFDIASELTHYRLLHGELPPLKFSIWRHKLVRKETPWLGEPLPLP